MKGQQHEEHHQENCTYHSQKHIAANQQSVHYLWRNKENMEWQLEYNTKLMKTQCSRFCFRFQEWSSSKDMLTLLHALLIVAVVVVVVAMHLHHAAAFVTELRPGGYLNQ